MANGRRLSPISLRADYNQAISLDPKMSFYTIGYH
jgi:hypothetical protein